MVLMEEAAPDVENAATNPGGFVRSAIFYMLGTGLMLGLAMAGYNVIGTRISGLFTGLSDTVSASAGNAQSQVDQLWEGV